MMPADTSFDGWELVQRQGQDIAQNFSSLAHRFGSVMCRRLPSFEDECVLPPVQPPEARIARSGSNSSNGSSPQMIRNGSARVSSSLTSSNFNNLGQQLRELRADIGCRFDAVVNRLKKRVALPFQEENQQVKAPHTNVDISLGNNIQQINRNSSVDNVQFSNRKNTTILKPRGKGRFDITDSSLAGTRKTRLEQVSDEEIISLFRKQHEHNQQKQVSVNLNAVYNSRSQDVEASLSARGNIWRAEASRGHSNVHSDSSSPFLLQIGPFVLLRGSTVLFPVNLSKQHLLWYSFDRKNNTHSICPAIWSKHRNWLFMSMVSLNRLSCSFMDFQFPNGRLTYVAGEGLSSSVFFPALGGVLQGQSHTAGPTKMSYSRKLKWGTTVMSSLQLPEKSVSVDVMQPLAWHTSGVMVRPAVQVRFSPTFGGRNSGWRSEIIYSPHENISWGCGYSLTIQPTAHVSVMLGKTKENDSGNSGLKLQVEAPMENLRRASVTLQLSGSLEF